MFDLADVQRAKYFPELLPGSDVYTSIPAGQIASPSPLDLRRFQGRAVELSNISLNASADIEIEIRTDKRQRRILTSALDQNTIYPFSFTAREYIGYIVYNVGSVVNNWRTVYGLWVFNPSIADKLKNKWPLTQEENDLARELGITASVEKGVLPLPKSIVLEREYQVLYEFVQPRAVTVPISPNRETIFDFYTESADEFLVLKGFTCSDTTFASNIQVFISRDENIDYVAFSTAAIGNVGKINCWIPALNEIKIDVSGAIQVTGVNFTVDVIVCRLTNTLRAKWNLPGDIPDEVIKKVKGGVL